MTPLRKVLLDTGLAWVARLSDPTNEFSNGRTPDAVHTILPESLGIRHQMSNAATTEWLATSLPGLHNYTVDPVGDMPTFVDVEERTIVVHLTGGGQSDIGPYKNEYMWVLKTTEDGKLIKESWEYIDSSLIEHYFEGGNRTLA